MNDKKLELLKKKALLEDFRRRKQEREQLKNESKLSNENLPETQSGVRQEGGLSYRSYTNDNFRKSDYRSSSNILNEFNNLNANEILEKVDSILSTNSNSAGVGVSGVASGGGGSGGVSSKSTHNGFLTTSSSSFSLSHSSSTQSINSYSTLTSTSNLINFNGNNRPNKINSNLSIYDRDYYDNNGNIYHKSNSSFDLLNKKFEKLELKPQLNLNIVDIFPNEVIKYAKETQTTDINNDAYSSDEDSSNNYNNKKKSNNKKHNNKYIDGDLKTIKKNKKKAKPLAFYEDVFVYDTLQWEDEFTPLDDDKNQNIKTTQPEQTHSNQSQASQPPNHHHHHLNNNISNNNHNHNNNIINSIKTADLFNNSNLDSDNYDDDDIVEAIDHNLKQFKSFSNDYDYDDNGIKSNRSVDYEDFLKFLVEKKPIVERALRQNERNIFFDYSNPSEQDKKIKEELNDVTIELKKSFYAPDKWGSSVVACLDWSLQYPELILCSYDNMSLNPTSESNSIYSEDSEAIAVIWNAKSDQKVPQQTFTSTSFITSCVFSSFHPNIVIAGTYSGQIVMWDVRSNKRTPVQRSSLSISSHVNPVYCIRVIGTPESHNLVSISNDGKLCCWSLENLNLPYDTQDLVIKNSGNKSVYATCFDLQVNQPAHTDQTDLNKLNMNDDFDKNKVLTNSPSTSMLNNQRSIVIGAEDGLAHSLSITNNNKLTMGQTYNDHFGPITSVSCYSHCYTNDFNNNSSLSQLFLTSSFDSNVKLWNMDSSSPLYSFECNGEYVYDVGWSPIHPSLFASVDGSGRLDLWNLNKNVEMPVASVDVENRTRALNKLRWSRSGTEIAVGDDHGKISIYEINENFANPNADDYDNFLIQLDNMKQLMKESLSFEKSDISSLIYSIESLR